MLYPAELRVQCRLPLISEQFAYVSPLPLSTPSGTNGHDLAQSGTCWSHWQAHLLGCCPTMWPPLSLIMFAGFGPLACCIRLVREVAGLGVLPFRSRLGLCIHRGDSRLGSVEPCAMRTSNQASTPRPLIASPIRSHRRRKGIAHEPSRSRRSRHV